MTTAVATLSASELVLGRYRPLRPLGSGGSGSVWLARDETNGLDVALKIVTREGKAGTRAEREAEAAARLRHPRCLRAYSFDGDDRNVYIAYEYVPGQTLRDRIRGGDLTDAGAIEVGAQVLEGLGHAHANGIVHRDVKPTNVLVADGPEIEVRLLDFGLAQFAEAETLTGAGDVPGTLAYISPERLQGEESSFAADVWAVGVVLWEALTGYHPFWSSSPVETARRIDAGAPPLESQRPDLPRALCDAVNRALAIDPKRRPTALQLAQRLRDALGARTRRKRPSTLPVLPAPPLQRAAAAAAAGVFTVGAGVLLPFYPVGWAWGIGALAAALTVLRPRLGLAFALATAVLPLGNVSLALALVYSAGAVAWLVATWRRPEEGLYAVAGPLLALLGATALLPLAVLHVRSAVWRGIHVALGVLLAAVVAGLSGATLPLSGREPPSLGIAGSEDPGAVVTALFRALVERPEVPIAALTLGLFAALLPLLCARGLWAIAGLGAAALAALLLPVASVQAVPVVAGIWLCCAILAVRELRPAR
ncbi:MAG TPA: serine/threonine-protein kinase [Gaiellaceae bacterium]|nr:serine/threonine-protein kinase [Gaiellaceae bacterium]